MQFGLDSVLGSDSSFWLNKELRAGGGLDSGI